GRRAGHRVDIGRIDKLARQPGGKQEAEIAEHHPEAARDGPSPGLRRGATRLHGFALPPSAACPRAGAILARPVLSIRPARTAGSTPEHTTRSAGSIRSGRLWRASCEAP